MVVDLPLRNGTVYSAYTRIKLGDKIVEQIGIPITRLRPIPSNVVCRGPTSGQNTPHNITPRNVVAVRRNVGQQVGQDSAFAWSFTLVK